jgi:hypothetical protein
MKLLAVNPAVWGFDINLSFSSITAPGNLNSFSDLRSAVLSALGRYRFRQVTFPFHLARRFVCPLHP